MPRGFPYEIWHFYLQHYPNLVFYGCCREKLLSLIPKFRPNTAPHPLMQTIPLSQLRGTKGFTLIELLVVISIIAMLAAGSVGIYNKVINNVTKTKCAVAIGSLNTAIKSFYMEFDAWPVDTGSGGADVTCQTDDGSIIRSLRGKDEARNPKRLNLLDGMKQARKGPNGPEDGLDENSNPDNPSMYDPWGTAYKIVLDSDFNEQIENPDSSGGGQPIRNQRCIVYSAGKDRNFDTWTDNVKSW